MINLTKKELFLNVVFPFLTFVLGIVVSFVLSRIVPETEDKIIRKNKIDGYNQKIIKEIPSIQAFQDYLSYIENKDTAQIWEHMSQGYRNSFGTPKNLLYSYYLTDNYNVKFIVPINENKFFVYMRFEDDVIKNEIINIKKFINTPINSINDSMLNVLYKEIYRYIDRRFVIEDEDFVKDRIKEHVSKKTMHEFVAQDWRLPIHIATELQLPLKSLDRKVVDYKQGHDMICEVEMESDNDIWKVKKFEMIAISRWK